ncbi:MAG: hypothetical protein LBP76_10375 [Treponema sp.]|nr:hypothetical protein [Treponema sp.]
MPLLLLAAACGELDTVFPSSGTYRMDALVNEASLDDYSVIKQTDAIRPYFINSTENDPDLRGVEVFLQTMGGQIVGRKIRYILGEGNKNTTPVETIKTDDALETESVDGISDDKKSESGSEETKTGVEEIVFELTRLNNDDMPAFSLPSDLDIGCYKLIFEVLGESTTLSRIEKTVFFLKDAEFTINDIQSFLPGYTRGSHLVPPGTEVLLEVEVSASPYLNPYVVWYSAQKRIGESFVSGGNSRIIWTAPSRTGFQTVRAEVFPFRPVSGTKGLSRELSIPVSAKNGDIGYFVQEADNLTHWFQLGGNLYDTKAPLDNQRALSRPGSTLPRWLTDMGIYGLAVGPEDVWTLSLTSFKTENEKEGKGFFMLYFKPLKDGVLFTAEFKLDDGEKVRLSLSVGDGLLNLDLSSPNESRQTSFRLDYLEPESFIPAVINFTFKEKLITASLSIKDEGINTAELALPLFQPLNGEALLSFGLQAELTDVDIQAYPDNAEDELDSGSIPLDFSTRAGVTAILDEFAISFSTQGASEDEKDGLVTEDKSSKAIQFTNSVQKTQRTATGLQASSPAQIEVIVTDDAASSEGRTSIKPDGTPVIPSKPIGGGGGGG